MKRFTETTKWDDPWFMDLPVKYKVFWLYICDRCDCAGFWEPNMRLAIAQIGEPMELVEILRVFEKRIEQTNDGKLLIRKFVEFQQGPELNPANNAHLGILKRFNLNNVLPPVPIKKNNSPCQGANVGLTSPTGTSTSKGTGTPTRAREEKRPITNEQRPITKYGFPLPARCTIRSSDQAVLDYSGRVMDINQVRAAQ